MKSAGSVSLVVVGSGSTTPMVRGVRGVSATGASVSNKQYCGNDTTQ